MAVRAVIFDYKCLKISQAAVRSDLIGLLQWIRSVGLGVCVFSTDRLDLSAFCAAWGLPELTELVHRGQVEGGKNRGSPVWVDQTIARFGLRAEEFLYVGSTAMDWRTAINSGVAYLHAGWVATQPAGTTSLTAAQPHNVERFLRYFFLAPPRWSFVEDDSVNNFSLRTLLPADAVLPANNSHGTFRLQDIFTYGQSIQVAGADARDLLLLHVVSSCYVEGLLGKNSFFCVYPSSRVGQVSQQIEEYVKPAASLVHGYYKGDLLIRETRGVDTSLARVQARRAGRTPNVSIQNQTSTVRLGEKYRGKLSGRRIVVFDDFTTTGTSLEWARNLLLSAGAEDVVLVTMGKYSSRYVVQEPRAEIKPFTLNPSLGPSDFGQVTTYPTEQPDNRATMRSLFQDWINEGPA